MISPPPFKVTILLSVYNDEATLDRCFESIAAQGFQDFSIICINDASTDRSNEILRKWQLVFEGRFFLIQNETNLGLTKSLNRGLENISTPYTARIDADDWWHPDKLERQITFLETHPDCGLIGCAYTNVFRGGQKTLTPPESDAEIREKIFGYNPFAHSAVIFRTELVKAIGGYDETVYYGQDYDLWLRLLPKTTFYNLSAMLCYRTGDAGLSKERQNDQLHQYMRTQWKYLRLYQYPLHSYFSLIRPILVIGSPDWLKRLKRRFFL